MIWKINEFPIYSTCTCVCNISAYLRNCPTKIDAWKLTIQSLIEMHHLFYCRSFRKRNGRDFEENCAEKAGSFYKHPDDVSSDWIGFSLCAGADSVRHSEALWWKRQTYAGHYGNGSAWKTRQVQQSLVEIFIRVSMNILYSNIIFKLKPF